MAASEYAQPRCHQDVVAVGQVQRGQRQLRAGFVSERSQSFPVKIVSLREVSGVVQLTQVL